tara:strand:- start:298 stop:1950 length:1653 start_codon:yes stop_codon:yes gene_type:complete
MEVEELSGRKLIDGENIITPQKDNSGVDIYISTSSAGGGLQMMVAGVVKSMTGESAERAALGAGSIVMDVLASNDGRKPHEKITRIRQLRPDMILLSGGIDGGTTKHVVELAEILAAANPQPRLGQNYKLPVIYAGNKKATSDIKKTLGDLTDLDITENIRPVLEQENLKPSRDKIHDLFMEHVMQQAPGYKKLMSWTDAPIMPTPGAVGALIEMVAEKENISVVGVDIGGATTDIFSVFQKQFNRTVSANLGMSYSICNVLAEAGLENVLRWVPFDIDEKELTNRIGNKMIRPTTVPQSLEELVIEQAIAREALRLSFIQHKEFAVNLKGVQKERTISDAFEQSDSGQSLVNMMELDLIVGSGGVLSHAPRRQQSAKMLIDSFLPEGITALAVDSIFMMPQLGVMANIEKKDLAEQARIAALEVFDKDCLIRLGTCIAPVGSVESKKDVLKAELEFSSGEKKEINLDGGDLVLIEADYQEISITLTPSKGIDVGAGVNETIKTTVYGGQVGIIFDCRGRPLSLSKEPNKRISELNNWSKALNEYPSLEV